VVVGGGEEGVGEGLGGADVACVWGCCVQLVGMRVVPRVFKAFKSCFCRVCRYC